MIAGSVVKHFAMEATHQLRQQALKVVVGTFVKVSRSSIHVGFQSLRTSTVLASLHRISTLPRRYWSIRMERGSPPPA